MQTLALFFVLLLASAFYLGIAYLFMAHHEPVGAIVGLVGYAYILFQTFKPSQP
jgi:energy-converting hydrogenase Eha subunit C